jgi:hypothetical protein
MTPNGEAPRKSIEQGYLAVLGASIFYALSIQYVFAAYAAPNWPIFSFPYSSPTLFGYAYLFTCLALGSTVAARVIDRPSNLILSFTYIFIIVPLVVAAACMQALSEKPYYTLAFFALCCFIAVCLLNGRITSHQAEVAVKRHETPALMWLLLAGFAVLAGYLYYRFSDIMNLVGLDSLYEQRSLGRATNFVDGYAQTYSQYVFSTGLVAVGLFKKNYVVVLLGLAGSLLNYSITAEKAGALFPVFIIGLYVLLNTGKTFFHSTMLFMLGFGTVNYATAFLYGYSSIIETVVINFGARSTLTPGVFVFHYFEFFGDRGYTYFAHIRGLDLFVPPPLAYAGDIRWPMLGLIVGEDYIQYEDLNANVNFVGTDGVASFGILGIAIPFAVLFGIARVFDYVAKGIPIRLSLPLLVPVALALSNSSAFSVLTSFGGFFWILVFATLFRSYGYPAQSPDTHYRPKPV